MDECSMELSDAGDRFLDICRDSFLQCEAAFTQIVIPVFLSEIDWWQRKVSRLEKNHDEDKAKWMASKMELWQEIEKVQRASLDFDAEKSRLMDQRNRELETHNEEKEALHTEIGKLTLDNQKMQRCRELMSEEKAKQISHLEEEICTLRAKLKERTQRCEVLEKRGQNRERDFSSLVNVKLLAHRESLLTAKKIATQSPPPVKDVKAEKTEKGGSTQEDISETEDLQEHEASGECATPQLQQLKGENITIVRSQDLLISNGVVYSKKEECQDLAQSISFSDRSTLQETQLDPEVSQIEQAPLSNPAFGGHVGHCRDYSSDSNNDVTVRESEKLSSCWRGPDQQRAFTSVARISTSPELDRMKGGVTSRNKLRLVRNHAAPCEVDLSGKLLGMPCNIANGLLGETGQPESPKNFKSTRDCFFSQGSVPAHVTTLLNCVPDSLLVEEQRQVPQCQLDDPVCDGEQAAGQGTKGEPSTSDLEKVGNLSEKNCRKRVPEFPPKAPPFKFVEPVRNKRDREALPGTDCKQCRKFYEAVLAEDEKAVLGNLCTHCDAASRHRYRWGPPATPEGFWNIGFDSDR